MSPLSHLMMGLHYLLLTLLVLVFNKREVAALDLDASDPQLVAEGGEVELACQVNS